MLMDMHVYDLCMFVLTLIESVAIVLGNGFMVLTFIRHRALLNAMNCYICSMCIAGLITGFLVPLGFGNYIGPYTVSGTLLSKCDGQKVKACIFYATACNSVMCMLAIAVERWRTLSTSNSRQRRVANNGSSKLVVLVCWIISAVYAFSLIFIFKMEEIPVQYQGSSTNSCYLVNQTACGDFEFCMFSDPSAQWQSQLFHIATLVLIFIVPLCAISIIYAVLVTRLLRNAQRSEKANRGSCSIHRAKLRAIQAMIVVVVVFALCWLPGHLMLVYFISTNPHHMEEGAAFHTVPISLRIIHDFCVHLVITHHWIQVFIYPRYSRQLANAIKETAKFLFSWVCWCCNRGQLQQGVSQPASKTSKFSNAPATICITTSL